MNRKALNCWIGLAGVLLTAYPLSAPVTALLPGGNTLAAAGYLALCGLTGYLILGVLMGKNTGLRLWNVLVTILLFVGLAAGLYFLFLRGTFWLTALLLMAEVGLMLRIGYNCAEREYQHILREAVFDRITILYLVSTLVMWAIVGKISFWPMALTYLGVLTAYGYLKNQSNMDKLTTSRHFTLDFLPEKIRSYNVALLSVLLVILLVVFAAFSTVQRPMEQVASALRTFTFSFLSGGDGYESYWENQEGDTAGGDLLEAGETPLWVQVLQKAFHVLIGLLIVFLFLLLLYYFRETLFRWASGGWSFLMQKLQGLFRKRSTGETETEFVDTDQSIGTAPQRQPADDLRRRTKAWKREYREYQKMEEKGGKFAYGYCLARRGLELAGAGILPADTPIEAAGKGEEILARPGYREVSECYSAAYYGERPVSPEEAAQLEATLKQISRLPFGKPRAVPAAPERESPEKRRDRIRWESAQPQKQEKRRHSGAFSMLIFGGVIALVILLTYLTSFFLPKS